MAFCTKCGSQVEDGQVCSCEQQASTQQAQQPAQNNYQFTAQATDNKKTYSILAYIGILWLIGLFVQEKNDPRVKFNVGQGIILSILSIGGLIVISILRAIFASIFKTEIVLWGYRTGTYETAGWVIALFGLLSWALGIAVLVLMIMGIMNVVNNKDKPLPIIGKFAFYK